ncbi:MAG: hydroxymethylbilane synthase [Chloroflexota bacterium]|nr:hydroxymethylbilane synthase [Chloroflexota bacterium]
MDRLKTIRIGTRRSKLSIWQAEYIAELIKQRHAGIEVEIREYRTRSDLNPVAPLREIAGRGIFTDALETALRSRDIDCAVHSLKDMPVEMGEGLALAAIPQRDDHRDALVSRSGVALADLPQGARIGTGSLRRRAQLLAVRPDLKMMHIRGNVPTRLDKLMASDSPFDAIVLAAAGLNRLGLSAQISEIFDESRMLSAAGQGALAVQCRAEQDALTFFGTLADWRASHSAAAERSFLHALEAGCSLPVAAYAKVAGTRLSLQGRVIALDGARQVDVSGDAIAFGGLAGLDMARKLGAELAEEALKKGADLILDSLAKGQAHE